MEKQLSPKEAFLDFLQWMQERKSAGIISAIPKDVQEAKYANEGQRQYPLGEKRIKTLLGKYAPDRYEFRGIVILKENV